MFPRAARVGLAAGAVLSVPAWYLLNACALNAFVGVPKSWPAVALAATLVGGVLAATGALAAQRARAERLADGIAAGMAAGALAAVPIAFLVVPGVAAVSLGISPLLTVSEAVDGQALRTLAAPVVIEALWTGPLFTLGLGAWLTVIGGISGGNYYLWNAALHRAPAPDLARTTA